VKLILWLFSLMLLTVSSYYPRTLVDWRADDDIEIEGRVSEVYLPNHCTVSDILAAPRPVGPYNPARRSPVLLVSPGSLPLDSLSRIIKT